MSPTLIAIVFIRMLVSGGVIAALVFCDSYTMRMGLGVGIMTIVTPATVYLTHRKTRQSGYDCGFTEGTKSGFDAGYIKAAADLVREHCRLHE